MTIKDTLILRLSIITASITAFSLLLNERIGVDVELKYFFFSLNFANVLEIGIILFVIALLTHLTQFLLFLSFDYRDQSHRINYKWCNITMIFSLLNVNLIALSIVFLFFEKLQDNYPLLAYIIKLGPIIILSFLIWKRFRKR